MLGGRRSVGDVDRKIFSRALLVASSGVEPDPRLSTSYAGEYRRACNVVFPDELVVLVMYVLAIGRRTSLARDMSADGTRTIF